MSSTFTITGKIARINFFNFFEKTIDKQFLMCYNSRILIKKAMTKKAEQAFSQRVGGGANRQYKCSIAHHFRAGGSKDMI